MHLSVGLVATQVLGLGLECLCIGIIGSDHDGSPVGISRWVPGGRSGKRLKTSEVWTFYKMGGHIPMNELCDVIYPKLNHKFTSKWITVWWSVPFLNSQFQWAAVKVNITHVKSLSILCGLHGLPANMAEIAGAESNHTSSSTHINVYFNTFAFQSKSLLRHHMAITRARTINIQRPWVGECFSNTVTATHLRCASRREAIFIIIHVILI